eukprot:TRINITY_DN5139_c0_g1_i5.p1 TRINITY_DN5139_c0_g1~~TRINITY_DN5139_c0_g1_i5.p1  ORF type:complete len:278 (+),score=32.88 TRINITY_DN5139_c0_g1_i5:226-1059(+)
MSLKDNLPNPVPSPSPSSAVVGTSSTLSQRSPQQTRTKEVPEEPSAPGSFLFGNTRYFELNKLYTQYYNAFRKNKGIADWPSRSKHLVLSYLVDWIVLVMLLALLGLHYAKPPVFYFRLDDPEISYPLVDQTISATAITLVIILGPLAVVAFAQIWVRSMRDFHQSAMATLQLFVITQLICEFMWTLVGGLRPTSSPYANRACLSLKYGLLCSTMMTLSARVQRPSSSAPSMLSHLVMRPRSLLCVSISLYTCLPNSRSSIIVAIYGSSSSPSSPSS